MLTPKWIIIAIVLGLVATFVAATLTTPSPVNLPTVEITPVPTPAPVYINQMAHTQTINYGQVVGGDQIFDVNYGQIINGRYPISDLGQCINCK
jgi:hypothetical protein